MIRAQAGQDVNAELVNATTGAAFVGTVTVYITIDQGAQAIGSVGSGICSAKGNGLYQYLPSLAETDGTQIKCTFIGTGAVPVNISYNTITAQQTSGLSTASGLNAVSIQVIVSDALVEFGYANAGDPMDPGDAEFALGKLNRLLDNWNAERATVYAQLFSTYTCTASLEPHTIGPTGTFVVTQRPVSIESANWLVNGYLMPITLRDQQWWTTPGSTVITSAYPTDLYYDPTWPNGSLYFYPIVSAATVLQLSTRVVLGSVVLSDTFSLPPGYRDAITLTLAEECASAFGQTVTMKTTQGAMKARARIFTNNVGTPNLDTRDSGMPGAAQRGTFNYMTGQIQ